MIRKTIAGLVLALLAWPLAASAVDLDERFGVGLEGGMMKLIGGEHDYSNVDQFAGLRLRHGLTSRWTLDLGLTYGYIRPGVEHVNEDAGLTTKSGAGLYTTMLQPTAGALYRFTTRGRFSPYLGGSVGVMQWRVRDERGNEDVSLFPDGPVVLGYDSDGAMQRLKATNVTAGAALGVEYFPGETVGIDLGVRYHYLFGNDVDNVGWSAITSADPAAQVDANRGRVEGFLGVTLYFGSADSDGDGIANAQDACPDQPEDFDGFQDNDGCPDPDNDGDGIPDVSDKCPDQPEDLDGFRDQDGCPDPDNDGDGIVDARDDCPDEPEDVDGYQDRDGCPDPDDDGDGVLDAQDQCPGTPAGVAVDAKGCPQAAEIKASLVLEGVNFESGKAALTPGSVAVLDEVAASLKAYPDVRVEIAGYTDSSGPEELNRELSQQRAEAVRQYLIAQGVGGSRLVARGYGEENPVATNATPVGRAQNRRVELHRLD